MSSPWLSLSGQISTGDRFAAVVEFVHAGRSPQVAEIGTCTLCGITDQAPNVPGKWGSKIELAKLIRRGEEWSKAGFEFLRRRSRRGFSAGENDVESVGVGVVVCFEDESDTVCDDLKAGLLLDLPPYTTCRRLGWPRRAPRQDVVGLAVAPTFDYQDLISAEHQR